MLTCAFIVCVLQAAIAGINLTNRRLPLGTAQALGHMVALALAGYGASGLFPLVFGGV